MIEKGKHWISFVSERSDKVKNERRSFPYDPDRTKTDDDFQAEKIHKKLYIKMKQTLLRSIDLRLPVP
jgi:hypothetical protein